MAVLEYKKLKTWQDSMTFVSDVYKVLPQLPETEKYGLASQMRRAAVSIPSNIAEGSSRKTPTETIHFLYISLGSLSELETQFLIAQNIGYIHNIDSILSQISDIRNQIYGLIRFLNTKSE